VVGDHNERNPWVRRERKMQIIEKRELDYRFIARLGLTVAAIVSVAVLMAITFASMPAPGTSWKAEKYAWQNRQYLEEYVSRTRK